MSDLTEPPKLNPAQQQVTDDLGAKREERPSFRDDLREHLRHEIEETIGPVLTDIAELPMFVSKHDLSTLHSCEARYVAERNIDFAWTVPMARGSVAHKAIELLVTWRGEPVPLELVDEAMARLVASERGVGVFIHSLTEAERAELAGRANDFVATFLDTFPPLNRRWVPVAESRVRAELCEDQLALQGRVDLSLGRPDGNVAGKVLIDFKTGRPSVAHIEDLRFYALLETLKVGVPPRLLVNYYLEAGEPRREEVTEDLLWSAAKRLVDAVGKLIELDARTPRSPTTSPGPACRWCPAAGTCDDGRRYLARADEADEADGVLPH
ncbi:MAG: PD-(D/E)XK nuclease family protein [Acidimicrobiia bacterium]|nr:PD-(D/E)XK nuclease family protein [Acidimicrobiia bacterium]